MRLTPGNQLGSYEIVAPLGAGGMGEVYRAHDGRLGRDVAIKLLPEELASHAERLARLEREARTVAALNHPNIVTLYSFEEAGGIRFLTMELVEGAGLDQLIAPGGLPLERVLDLSIALSDALVAAHGRGVVHRDLKPGNVMVTREGRVKVLDFGLAKLARSESDPVTSEASTVTGSISSRGQAIGTVPYMAPEQVRGEAVDARTDLFAFGVLLYELLTGRRPFGGASRADVASAILRDAPAAVGALRSDLPGDMNRIVARCLEKDPRDRFQTARAVHEELRQLSRTLERAVSPVPAARLRAAGSAAPSIAVLPFVSRSREEEDEYFSEGLADELLHVLTKIPGLRVASQSSTLRFQGSEDPGLIGRKLNVATLLEGTVRKAGDRVRISVRLVKVADGYHLWSETYDRTLDDIFAVQDDIAQAVVKELRTTLMGEAADSGTQGEARADVAAASRGRGGSGEAHRLFLQGRHLVERESRSETERGIGYLKRAVEVDPTHALAWAALARAYVNQAGFGWDSLEQAYHRALDAARQSVAIEPALAEGHTMLGWIEVLHGWNWRAADASYRRALELAPANPEVLRGAGALALTLGRVDEAIELARRSVDQDPLSPSSHATLGHALRAMGFLGQAEDAYRKVLELAPQRVGIRLMLSLVLFALGRPAEAVSEAEAEPEGWARWSARGIVQALIGNSAASDEALERLTARYAEANAFQIAMTHAARLDRGSAFRWLEAAYQRRDPGLSWTKVEPLFRPLHADPRWEAFVRKLGLEGGAVVDAGR